MRSKDSWRQLMITSLLMDGRVTDRILICGILIYLLIPSLSIELVCDGVRVLSAAYCFCTALEQVWCCQKENWMICGIVERVYYIDDVHIEQVGEPDYVAGLSCSVWLWLNMVCSGWTDIDLTSVCMYAQRPTV